MRIVFIIIMLIVPSIIKAQDGYKYWFSDQGVEVYLWYYDGMGKEGIDKHVRVKLINRNSYDVDTHWDSFRWEYNGSVVKTHEAQGCGVKAGEERSGDGAGLWWYPPNGYNMHDLKVRFMNFTVTRKQ